MKNENKAKQIAIKLMGGGDRNIQPLVDALIEMAQWKDEQARQQRAKTYEASKLSNRVQEMQNLLEWLYQNAPDVYDMAEKEIREWQNIASMKLNEELEKAEKEG